MSHADTKSAKPDPASMTVIVTVPRAAWDVP